MVHVAVGALHCLAATADGQIYSWGDNDHGQQGNGSTAVNKRPIAVTGLPTGLGTPARVAAGSSHSLAWTSSRTSVPLPAPPLTFQIPKDPLGAHSLGKFY